MLGTQDDGIGGWGTAHMLVILSGGCPFACEWTAAVEGSLSSRTPLADEIGPENFHCDPRCMKRLGGPSTPSAASLRETALSAQDDRVQDLAGSTHGCAKFFHNFACSLTGGFFFGDAERDGSYPG